jgi:hypothetical protein
MLLQNFRVSMSFMSFVLVFALTSFRVIISSLTLITPQKFSRISLRPPRSLKRQELLTLSRLRSPRLLYFTTSMLHLANMKIMEWKQMTNL